MGLLSGKYSSPDDLAPGDVRRNTPWWTFFDDNRMPEWLKRIDLVRDVLTSGDRSLVQGAIAYVWGRSEPSSRTARRPDGCPSRGTSQRPGARSAHRGAGRRDRRPAPSPSTPTNVRRARHNDPAMTASISDAGAPPSGRCRSTHQLLRPARHHRCGVTHARRSRASSPDNIGWLRVVRCLRDTGMSMADLRRFCALDGDAEPGRRRGCWNSIEQRTGPPTSRCPSIADKNGKGTRPLPSTLNV